MPMSFAADAYRQEMWQVNDFQEEMMKSMRYFLQRDVKISANVNQEGSYERGFISEFHHSIPN